MNLRRLFPALLGVLALLVLSLPASAAVIPNGAYRITMSDSDMAVVPSSNTTRARVVLTRNRSAATWTFTHLGNDVYKISTKSLVLDSSESKRYNGVPIIVFPWHGGKNQQWKVVRSGQYYKLINVATGLAMDLPGNDRVNGKKFHGYERNSSHAQLFDLTQTGRKKKAISY